MFGNIKKALDALEDAKAQLKPLKKTCQRTLLCETPRCPISDNIHKSCTMRPPISKERAAEIITSLYREIGIVASVIQNRANGCACTREADYAIREINRLYLEA